MRRTVTAPRESETLLPLTQNDIHVTKQNGLSLMDKWRERKVMIAKGETKVRGHISMKLMICFHAPTYLYVMLSYIVPYLFEDYHPWTQYYFKLFIGFILMNVLVNFLCTITYNSYYIQTKDNPYFDTRQRTNIYPETFGGLIEQQQVGNKHGNGRASHMTTGKDGELDWRFCGKCDVYVPPRTYHCRFCKKCVLKRDHHCFIVGSCVGFKNQRYFIVMLLYCLVIGVTGTILTVRYIQYEIWPTSSSWSDYILPVTVCKWISGYIGGFETMLIVHCYIYALYILLGVSYFPSQMFFAIKGYTMFESVKKIPFRNSNTWKKNLTSVFGDCWALNFIFPMVLIFQQRDDGVHWTNMKIDYNSNQIVKDEDTPLI